MEHSKLRQLTGTALVTTVLCVMGPAYVPIGVIPVSLQVLGVYLAVCLLGQKRGTMAVALYLLIGCIGVPVFAGFSAGAARLVGPAGGFLVGFVPLALISGWFVDRFPTRPAMQLAGMAVGLLVLYAMGTAWLMYSTGLAFERAVRAAVLPFVALDCAKMVLAMILARVVRRRALGKRRTKEE